MKAAVDYCSVVEGPLYRVNGENAWDVFDCFVEVEVDGKRYVHKSFTVKGWFMNEDDGWPTPDRGAVAKARAFADKVEGRGSVDLAHWALVSAPD